jgi:hypothetical protein
MSVGSEGLVIKNNLLYRGGGIQLLGRCKNIEIRDNLIREGPGNGITLGSVAGEGSDRRPEGTLTNITITDNRIQDMAGNGIGVAEFFDLDEAPLLIMTNRLKICDNEIIGCLNGDLQSLPGDAAYAGIALADGELIVIRNNRIEDNGLTSESPVPVCGIFILHSEGVEITGNYICGNGQRPAFVAHTDGYQGGIVLPHATVPLTYDPESDGINLSENFFPAAKIHRNVVIAHSGRALYIQALGAVSVTDNYLACRGKIPDKTKVPLFGSAVYITNIGGSQPLIPQFFAFANKIITMETSTLSAGGSLLITSQSRLNGQVIFKANQVFLDYLVDTVSIYGGGLVPPRGGWSFLRDFKPCIATFILSQDDVCFEGNQVSGDYLSLIILANTAVFGATVRAANNVFKDQMIRGGIFSYISWAQMNTAINNQATHCYWVDAANIGGHKFLEQAFNQTLETINQPPDISALCNFLKSIIGSSFPVTP